MAEKKKKTEKKKIILTEEGYKKLQDELENLKVNKRKEISQSIKEARTQGDLSENAEYDAAKDEQKSIESRIEEIENTLKNAEIFKVSGGDSDIINIGCTVWLKDLEFDEEMEYTIVGSIESDVLNGKISNESPVGEALIGSKVGDVVEVETPSGETAKYKIINFEKPSMA